MRYAIIDTNGNVVNVIEYDSEPSSPPPGFDEGIRAVQSDTAGPDWTYSNGSFSAPPATPLPPRQTVPWSVVSPRQARLALYQAGLLDQVEAAVKAAGGSVQIEWEYASVFERNDPLVLSIGSSLNLTSDQLDGLFKVASTI